MSEEAKEIRSHVWNQLLNVDEKFNDLNIYQKYSLFGYYQKPSPFEEDEQEGAIMVDVAQGRFLQMKDPTINKGEELWHLDLNSAYITALANVKNSLKFSFKYKLDHIKMKMTYDTYGDPIHHYLIEERFNIVKIKCKMEYNQAINIFTTNKKIKYKGREVSDQNIPNYLDIVDVNVELIVNKKYNLDSWDSWVKTFKYNNIQYENITVFVYDLIERPEMYTLENVKRILDEMKKVDREVKKLYKNALVSFTGFLKNVDSARRLIMLAQCEEVMRRLYFYYQNRTKIYGMQIDAIYFKPFKWNEEPIKIAHKIGSKVYNLKDYDESRFSKLEYFKEGVDYVETAFRLQQLR